MPNEIVWVLGWSLVALALTGAPYLLGLYLSSPEMPFGGFVYNVEDCNSYVAKMQQGAWGQWLFHLPYTSEDHQGALVFTFYLLLGKVVALSGLSSLLVYHLARLALAPFFLVTVYVFISHFTAWRAVRRLSFLMVVFSSGLGWLVWLSGRARVFGEAPIDFWVPDAFALLVIFAFPHLCLSEALILWTFLFARRGLESGVWRYSIVAGLIGLAVSLVHPYTMPVVGTVLGGYTLLLSWRRRRLLWEHVPHLLIVVLPAAPYLCYSLYVFSFNPAFRAWREQSYTLSPHPLHYVLGYALVLLLAVAGARYLWKRADQRGLLLVCWVVIVFPALYFPFKMQRRLIEGLQIPLCLLATWGLVRYLLPALNRSRVVDWLTTRFRRYTRSRMRRLAARATVFITTPSHFLLIGGLTLAVLGKQSPIFLTGGEVEAFDWLAAHAAPSEVVLTAYHTGNYLPTRVRARVFIGLGTETVDYQTKAALVEQFFGAGATDDFRRRMLEEYGIDYVFYGPQERELGDFDGQEKPFLRRVYHNPQVGIYSVEGEL